MILADAIKLKASDIHLEPREDVLVESELGQRTTFYFLLPTTEDTRVKTQ